jgi:regulator of protease activity HflC (stomatin/prohibitin superfamily)
MPARVSSASASVALGLVLLSLIIIYLVVPQTFVVATISVMIAMLTLVIALVGDQADVRVITGVSAALSLIAAGFLGEAWLGLPGSLLVPSLWFVVLLYTFRRLRASTLVIPADHAVMYAPFLSSQVYQVDAGSTVPVTVLDRQVATVPLYELTLDTRVENVNTRDFRNIDMVEAHVRYRVNDPARALVGIPNRGKIQNDVAREMGLSLGRAQLDTAFWEKLLARQMAEEVDDILRAVAFHLSERSPNRPILGRNGEELEKDDVKPLRGTMLEAYLDRRTFSEAVLRDLKALVSRWGVTVTHLDLDLYKLNSDQIKQITQNQDRELAREKKKREAETVNDVHYIKQTAEVAAEAEAERIRKIVEILQNQLGREDLPREVLEEIIISAIRATSDAPLIADTYPGLFEENRSEKPSGGGSGSNGTRK